MFLGLDDHDIPSQDEVRSISLDVAFQLFVEKYARGRYGQPAIDNVDRVRRAWNEFYPGIETAELTPQVFVSWREKLVGYRRWHIGRGGVKLRPRQPPSRYTINQYAETARRAFRWMALQRFMSWDRYYLLMLVPALKAGETTARERQPRGLPSPETIKATMAVIGNESMRDLLWLVHSTGLMLNEVTRLRSDEIDRDSRPGVWLYHRQEKRRFGHDKLIELGPDAQAIIRRHESKKRGSPGTIFRNNKGNQWLCKVIATDLRRACHKAGVPVWAPTDMLRVEKMQPSE